MLKKFAVIALLLFAFIQTTIAMRPGPTLAVDCPKCGKEKKLMSLLSGNTFGARQWSDAYQYAPMLPQLSPVQKCPECGYYFMLSEDALHRATGEEEVYCSDTGRLSYAEMKEALLHLEKDSLAREDELSLRLEFLHRFNDAFRENFNSYEVEDADENKMVRNEADWELHRANLELLVALLDDNNAEQRMLLAEIYREMGKFDDCVSELDHYSLFSDDWEWITVQMVKKAAAEDNKVFELQHK